MLNKQSTRMKLLSIIIPHYNLPRELLVRCIDSIIAQEISKEEYEIIVVDDGSDTPPTWINEKYGDVARVFLNEHSGPGGSRNRGIKEAQGTYILFVDADDCLCPNTLHSCLEIIEREHPKIFRFQYRVCRNNEDTTKQTATKTFRYSNTISGASFMATNNLSGAPWTYIFDRDIAIKHNIRFETNVYHEDEEFNTKIHYYATSLIESNATVYNYCIRRESITSNTNKAFEEKRIHDLFSLLKRLTIFREETKKDANPIQEKGLDRKLTMLTVDVLLNLYYNKKGAREIHSLCKTQLHPLSLYPLPDRSFSLKYRIFRILANSLLGLHILRILLPTHKPRKR